MEIQYKLFKNFYRNAARRMCKELKPYISSNAKVLDLGCGSGIVTNQIKDDLKADITGIDIIDLRVEDIPFMLYDGKDLSEIKDNAFDTVLISYVLHHTENPKEILKQVKRIAKNNIIIYEDLYERSLGKIYCNIHGKVFNEWVQKNDIKAKFFSEKEWEENFKELGLKVIFRKEKPYPLNPVRRMLFVLKKGV
jgi:2-polyprenyl-3-methyl-5-hydroxy-6-metoxy-1,4-benzoquinol methylase